MHKQRWQLKQVVLMAVLAVVFGGVFILADSLYTIVAALLTPFGLVAFANEALFGLWIMAGPVIAMLIKRPGSAVIGEILSAVAEVLYGSMFGPAAIISGLIQGGGSELGFLATGYKRYDWLSLSYAGIGTTVLSFAYEYNKLGYQIYPLVTVVLLFLTRLLSVFVFGVVLTMLIVKLYDRVNVLAAANRS